MISSGQRIFLVSSFPDGVPISVVLHHLEELLVDDHVFALISGSLSAKDFKWEA